MDASVFFSLSWSIFSYTVMEETRDVLCFGSKYFWLLGLFLLLFSFQCNKSGELNLQYTKLQDLWLHIISMSYFSLKQKGFLYFCSCSQWPKNIWSLFNRQNYLNLLHWKGLDLLLQSKSHNLLNLFLQK